MTENEIAILWHLNNVRSQNNVYHVLVDTLKLTEYDIKEAINSLLHKKYVYDDPNENQLNLKMSAWKITQDGERKINELKTKIDVNKNAEAAKWIAKATFWATAVGTLAVIAQSYFNREQNRLLQEQNNIIQKEQNKPYLTAPQTQNVYITILKDSIITKKTK